MRLSANAALSVRNTHRVVLVNAFLHIV